ncbi:hypothetical protein TEA_027991 [Camellia sinensis var. sinensis]|uniref:Uncharacterized protein n=1 Tax=Camellia sinensis var. sinensis TaxID=542762 RepID=A0A4S4E4F0_CAMSN|nr:hypothetical protein TEA_027991 [Camellia sinensis var. sinensis]
MFDAYGNHVEGCLEIVLNVDGFCFQDHLGPIRKVDVHGCIDLSGLLKVTGGYGRKGKDLLLFVPEFCTAGALLENLVFEIINSDGDVDETIHDEELQGQSHMLMIKSESLDTDDSVRYSFHYGRCIVRAISLPQKEGLVCLEAAHSRHPELHLTIEVRVLEAPKVDPESIQPQYTDGKVFLLEDSSALKTPKGKHDGIRGQFSDGKILLLQDSSGPKDLEDLVASVRNDQKELEEAIFNYGLAVGHYEKALEMLHIRRVTLEHHVSVLQGFYLH